MSSLEKNIDNLCYEALKGIIGVLGLLSGILISWVSFFWSIGCFLHMDLKGGFLALLVFLLSIIMYKGGGVLLEKLNAKN